MAKSIVIQENGTSQTISVDKLRTRAVGGGTCTWVPVSGVKVAPVIIRKNGTYKAKDLGIYAISQVTVADGATGRNCEINGEKKDGTFKDVSIAISEGESARLFTVKKLKTSLSAGGTCQWAPESSLKLASKTLKKNGTYKPSSKYYGWSSVTVSIKHKSDGSRYNPYTPDDPYDPSTPAEAPAYIKVTKLPNDVTYNAGDTIDYTGIECTMYNSMGGVFTDSEHPNGKLSISELTFPTTKAPDVPDEEDNG